jgi:hypothetical protein
MPRLHKILISSTSEDLQEHRKRLMETLARLDQHSVAMEFFGATVNPPVAECEKRVDEADLVVLALAHRYGWIPEKKDGGDDKTSITRYEYRRAVSPPRGLPRKPVLAFLVDETAPWSGGKEQDRLVSAKSLEEAQHIFESVQDLRLFKEEVQSGGLVRDLFVDPGDLADKVGTAVANWLLSQETGREQSASAQSELETLMDLVRDHLAQGEPGVAMEYLTDAFTNGPPENRARIADERFDIASTNLSLHDRALLTAASDVVKENGTKRARAFLFMGKCESQLARPLWKAQEREKAWQLASEGRDHLVEATRVDPVNPDGFGTLGGVLKRMAEWARELHPDQVRGLEDAMLAAYRDGWKRVPDAYPLLNYIEQRAALQESRDPLPVDGRRTLIGAGEKDLRAALTKALNARKAQLGIAGQTPWAQFDLARGYHYLNPNVAGFLEDLQKGVDQARQVARSPEDRFAVTTTADSLTALVRAKVDLEGLEEGIALLSSAVLGDDWFSSRPKEPVPYLGKDLLALQKIIVDSLEKTQKTVADEGNRQASLTTLYGAEVSKFIGLTKVRWTREDEADLQAKLDAEIEQFQKDLEPAELKFLRGAWKIFGTKTFDVLTGGFVDWDAASELAASVVAKYQKRRGGPKGS